MPSGSANAWMVLAAWLGLMAGVGAALRPTAPVLLSAETATAQTTAWSLVLSTASSTSPALWVGDDACPCETGALAVLRDWAVETGLVIHPAPGMAGIALADSKGTLRYAGDPAALAAHCGGLRGFRMWWEGPASRPILTAPCPCA